MKTLGLKGIIGIMAIAAAWACSSSSGGGNGGPTPDGGSSSGASSGGDASGSSSGSSSGGSSGSSSGGSSGSSSGSSSGAGDAGVDAGPTPSIAITSPTMNATVTPTTNSTGQDVVSVSFQLTNFALAEPGTGACMASSDNCGHIHVLVDGPSCTPDGEPYDNVIASGTSGDAILSTCPTVDGPHTIRLELHHDDHSPVLGTDGGTVFAEVQVTVATAGDAATGG